MKSNIIFVSSDLSMELYTINKFPVFTQTLMVDENAIGTLYILLLFFFSFFFFWGGGSFMLPPVSIVYTP